MDEQDYQAALAELDVARTAIDSARDTLRGLSGLNSPGFRAGKDLLDVVRDLFLDVRYGDC